MDVSTIILRVMMLLSKLPATSIGIGLLELYHTAHIKRLLYCSFQLRWDQAGHVIQGWT